MIQSFMSLLWLSDISGCFLHYTLSEAKKAPKMKFQELGTWKTILPFWEGLAM